MTAPPDPVRLSLGAYLLGALDPAERAQVRAHLGGCAGCREELTELAGLPGLLGLLSPAEAHRCATGPTDTGLDRALADLAHHHHTRRRRRGSLAAAAAVLILAGVATAVAVTPTAATLTATNTTTGVSATATLHPQPSGTLIELRLHGVTPGQHCQLLAVATDGHQEVAGTWQAEYPGDLAITATTAIPPDQLTTLRVVTDHAQLVSLPVHS